MRKSAIFKLVGITSIFTLFTLFGCASSEDKLPEEPIQTETKVPTKEELPKAGTKITNQQILDQVALALDPARGGAFSTLENLTAKLVKSFPDVDPESSAKANEALSKYLQENPSLLESLKQQQASSRDLCFLCIDLLNIAGMGDMRNGEFPIDIDQDLIKATGLAKYEIGAYVPATEFFALISGAFGLGNLPIKAYADATVDVNIKLDPFGTGFNPAFLDMDLAMDVVLDVTNIKRFNILNLGAGGVPPVDIQIAGNITTNMDVNNFGKNMLDGELKINLKDVYISTYPDGQNDQPFAGGFLGLEGPQYGTITWSFVGHDGLNGAEPVSLSGTINVKDYNKPYVTARSASASSDLDYTLEIVTSDGKLTKTLDVQPKERLLKQIQETPKGPYKDMAYQDFLFKTVGVE
ncbi:MAG: hypothetical protein C4K58_07950 [Flavobacteriaceae bacterium]|nr:MAG: hypothetical protein C4K58_07950 [Flavobacteriaceae bacterium]